MDNPGVSVDHYENFPVASWLCPAALRPAVRALYRFARTADDLADEGDAEAARRTADLAAFRRDLESALDGLPTSGRWPGLFEDLGEAVRRHRLPTEPLHHLLDAFGQDVVQHRHADRASLLHYCSRSANPVGRLMLALYGFDDVQRLGWSDDICTALQLINFWQDVGVDASRGRVYLPEADCLRHGFDADALVAARRSGLPPPAGLPAALAEAGAWARIRMLQGAGLAHTVPGRAGWELRAVVQGGLRILDHLARSGWDAYHRRPTVGATDLPVIAWRMLRMSPPRTGARGPAGPR
jgi:squalene synthase HpnC